MEIAFITDPLESLKIDKDSSYAMMVEAAARGHVLWSLEQSDVVRLPSGMIVASARRLHLTGEQTPWYLASDATDRALVDFDAVMMRKDPPFDMEYVYSTYLLEQAERQGAKVFNKPRAIRDHNEKLAIMQFPEWIAPTLVTRDLERIRIFHHEHSDIILKPLDGMGGMGVFRVSSDGLNLAAIVEMLSAYGTRTIMAQRYIPEIAQGDKRVILIGGQVVPYALARIPQASEVRGNLAAGGIGRAQALSERDQQIAKTLAPELWARGLLIVGLDMIGEYLTEINVTSPTCLQEIKQQTGFNAALMLIEALECAVSPGNSLKSRF